MNGPTLYRSRQERMLAGVCGGLGQYLGMDATIVRLFFVLFTFANGAGFLLYLVMAVLMPAAAEGDLTSTPAAPFWENPQAIRLAGVSLVVIGTFTLLTRLNIPQLAWANVETLWPIMLVLGGSAMLWRALRG